MDKNIDTSITSLSTHNLSLTERKQISMSGIIKIISFDAEEFLMESTMGVIVLKGEMLEIIKLDTHDGKVSIKGQINQITYVDSKDKMKSKEDGFITKLFK